MSRDDAMHERFRIALERLDVEAVAALLEESPPLAAARPWEPRWHGTALESIAGRCVHHRPGAHRISVLLVEHGAVCDLPTAARAGLCDRVRAILEDDPSLLEQVDRQGRTALYRSACVYGVFREGEEVADHLIDRGAEVDLFSACTLGDRTRVESILAEDPTAAGSVDAEGMTALHWAVRNRRHREHALAITGLLLENGADVHAPNPTEEGMTALHHAAEWCASAEQVTALVTAGADLSARTPRGWTPLDYARDRGRQQMVAFLEGLGRR